VRAGPSSTLRRLAQLWGVYAYLDLLFVTRGFKQFVGYYVSDAVLGFAGLSAVLLLAERFGGVGPWSRDHVAFMLGYAMVVDGVLGALFGFNVLYVSRRLGRGQLDHTLIQPQPLWMALLTEGFMPFSGSGALLPGIGLLVWSARHLSLAPSAPWIGLLLLYIAASCVVVLAFSYLWGSLAFWAPVAAEEVSTSALRLLSQLKLFPLDGVAAPLAGGLVSLLPSGLAAWLPSRALLGIGGSVGPAAVVATPLAALAIAILAIWVFARGLHHYGHTGSQRYSSFGHRR
jgi:ABC-2 type transport system permease protein